MTETPVPLKIRVLAWSLAGLAQALFLLGGLNFLLNIVIFVRGDGATSGLASAGWILDRFLPPALALFAMSAAMPWLLHFPTQGKSRWLRGAFYLANALVVMFTVLSIAGLMAARGVSPAGFSGAIYDVKLFMPLLGQFDMLLSLLLLVGLVTLGVRAVYKQSYPVLLRGFGYGPARPAAQDPYGRSGGMFLDRFRGAMNQARRFSSSIALMGIRYADEIQLIEKYGRAGYEKAMVALLEETERVARRGEDRIQYRAQVVLSVLFADPEQARKAADRFTAHLTTALAARLPNWPTRVALGIAGMKVPSGGFQGMEDRELCEKLFWQTLDASREAQASGQVVIRFDGDSV